MAEATKILPSSLLSPKILTIDLKAYQNNQLPALQDLVNFVSDLKRAEQSGAGLGGVTSARANIGNLTVLLNNRDTLSGKQFSINITNVKQADNRAEIRSALYADDIAWFCQNIQDFLHTIEPKASFTHRQPYQVFIDSLPAEIRVANQSLSTQQQQQLFNTYKKIIGLTLDEINTHLSFLITQQAHQTTQQGLTEKELKSILQIISSSSLSQSWELYVLPIISGLAKATSDGTNLFFNLSQTIEVNGQTRSVVGVNQALAIANRYATQVEKTINNQEKLAELLPEDKQGDQLTTRVKKFRFDYNTGLPQPAYPYTTVAGEYVDYFQEVNDYLTGQKKLEAKAAEAAAEEETDEGGEADQVEEPPLQQDGQHSIQDLVTWLSRQLITKVDQQLPSLDQVADAELSTDQLTNLRSWVREFLSTYFDQYQTDYQHLLEQELARLRIPLQTVTDDQGVSYQVYDFSANRQQLTVLFRSFIDRLAADFLAAIESQLEEKIVEVKGEAAATEEAEEKGEEERAAEETEGTEAAEGTAAPGAAVPDITKTSVVPTPAADFGQVVDTQGVVNRLELLSLLEGQLARDYFNQNNLPPEIRDLFNRELNQLLGRYSDEQLSQLGYRGVQFLVQEFEYSPKLTILAQDFYLTRFNQFFKDSPSSLASLQLGVDTLLTLAADPAAFIDQLTPGSFAQYFGIRVSAAELAQLKKMLKPYVAFRRLQLASSGVERVTAWHKADQQDQITPQQFYQMAGFISQTGESNDEAIAALNYSADQSLDEKKRKYLEVLRETIIAQYLKQLDEQQAQAIEAYLQFEWAGAEAGVATQSLAGREIPDNLDYSSLVQLVTSGTIPGVEAGGGGLLRRGRGRSASDGAFAALGKLTKLGIEAIAPEAAPIINLLSAIGLDDETTGKIVAAVGAAVAAVQAAAIWLITHSLGALLGFGLGLMTMPILGPLAPAAGAFMGWGVEKGVIGKFAEIGEGLFGGAKAGAAAQAAGAGGAGSIGAAAAAPASAAGTGIGVAALSVVTFTGLAIGSVYLNDTSTSSAYLHPHEPTNTIIGRPGAIDSSKICWPADGTVTVTDYYGAAAGADLAGKKHLVYTAFGYEGDAIDVGLKVGEPIYAPFSGTIEYYRQTDDGPLSWDAGNYAILHGDNGLHAGFLHLKNLDQQPPPFSFGDHVNVQEVIAYSGATGRVVGAHLHFEVWGGSITYPDGMAPTQVDVGVNIKHTQCDDIGGGGGGSKSDLEVGCLDLSGIEDGPDKDLLEKAAQYLVDNQPAFIDKLCSVAPSVKLLRDDVYCRISGCEDPNSPPESRVHGNSNNQGVIVFYDALFEGTGEANVLYTLTHELTHQIQYYNPSYQAEFKQTVCGQEDPMPGYRWGDSCVEDEAETAARYNDVQRYGTPTYQQQFSSRPKHWNYAQNVLFN